MTGWKLLEVAAWVCAAVIAAWLVRDAFRTGRDNDEDFLVHTMEDMGEEADWQDLPEGQESGRSES